MRSTTWIDRVHPVVPAAVVFFVVGVLLVVVLASGPPPRGERQSYCYDEALLLRTDTHQHGHPDREMKALLRSSIYDSVETYRCPDGVHWSPPVEHVNHDVGD